MVWALMPVFTRAAPGANNPTTPSPLDTKPQKQQSGSGYAFSSGAVSAETLTQANTTPKSKAAGPSPAVTALNTFADMGKKAKKNAMIGRVNAEKLFTFNDKLGKDALKEKTYWDLYKDQHPVNRRWWLRWEKKMREESIFAHRIETMPVDQKYKLKKALIQPNYIAALMPVGMFLYIVFCYVRYQIWGVTPSEASMGTAKFIQMTPRPPGGGD